MGKGNINEINPCSVSSNAIRRRRKAHYKKTHPSIPPLVIGHDNKKKDKVAAKRAKAVELFKKAEAQKKLQAEQRRAKKAQQMND